MRFLITGGTGLIGKKIVEKLLHRGDKVNVLSRKRNFNSQNKNLKFYYWNPESGLIDEKSLDGVGVVINLAGTPIAQFWTRKVKKSILLSRINSVKTLSRVILKNKKHKIKMFLNASAIGIYPSKKNVIFEESQKHYSKTFLGNVVNEWEKKIDLISDQNIPFSILRIGLVLSNHSGFLKSLSISTRFYLGTWFGKGDNYYSWIHIEDLVNSIVYISDNKLYGTYNLVSPNPVKSKFFIEKLAKYLKRKIILPPIPTKIIKYFANDMSELLLFDQNVSCKKILSTKFKFKYDSLDLAFKNLLK
ncbi:MAG: TIGR01777 family protein [Flavobacteriaceae bacterium]|nr:TIGR01777 family protein [Flavobacteriaceae bacterium]